MIIAESPVMHIVLTRFNVRADNFSKAPQISWLRHRTALFEKVCFPSVESQTEQNFHWLLFIDPETPKEYLARLELLKQRRPFQLCVCRKFGASVAAREVHKHTKGKGTVMTTRLDNDDAISTTFVETLQGVAKHNRRCWINGDMGYKVNADGLFLATHVSNNFLSLVEDANGARTANCLSHSAVFRQEQVLHLPSKRLWLQVIHDRNEKNGVRAYDTQVKRSKVRSHLKGFCASVVTYVLG
jgi:hypothetical protein